MKKKQMMKKKKMKGREKKKKSQKKKKRERGRESPHVITPSRCRGQSGGFVSDLQYHVGVGLATMPTSNPAYTGIHAFRVMILLKGRIRGFPLREGAHGPHFYFHLTPKSTGCPPPPLHYPAHLKCAPVHPCQHLRL